MAKEKVSFFGLMVIAFLAFYFIQDAMRFDAIEWAQRPGQRMQVRKFLVAHVNPSVIQFVELSVGLLLLMAVVWHIYKQWIRKTN